MTGITVFTASPALPSHKRCKGGIVAQRSVFCAVRYRVITV